MNNLSRDELADGDNHPATNNISSSSCSDTNDSPTDSTHDNQPASDDAVSAPAGPDHVLISAEQLADYEARSRLADDYLNLAQRVQADFDNFRRRTRRENETNLRRVKGEILLRVLDVLANVERARAFADSASAQDIRDGLDLILKQLNDALESEGLVRIATSGRAFDPELHEAVSTLAVDNAPAGEVIDEISPGALLDGVVIRAAKVTVSQ